MTCLSQSHNSPGEGRADRPAEVHFGYVRGQSKCALSTLASTNVDFPTWSRDRRSS